MRALISEAPTRGGNLRQRVRRFFVRHEYAAGVSDPESARLSSPVVVWELGRCLFVAVTLVLFMFLVMYQNQPIAIHAHLFRASMPVLDYEQALALHAEVRPVLLRRMLNTTMCGASAINVRKYVRYAIILDDKGQLYRDIFNPELLRIDHLTNENISIRERSSICQVQQERDTPRHTAVYIRWRDEQYIQREALWMGRAAICIQHFLDMFEGHWPCSTDVDGRSRVPVMWA
jgi:peptide deformylase